jgi:hypothetical protein
MEPQINFGDLTPYLTYWKKSLTSTQEEERIRERGTGKGRN